MSSIARVPPTLDLELYAGDGVAIQFTLTDSNGVVFPLDGVVTSQIKAKRSDTDPLVEWVVDEAGFASGVVTLSLSGEQTASLINGKPQFAGVWDMQYVPTGSEPMTFFQGKILCDADVTR